MQFTVYGKIVGKARPRVVRGHAYIPKPTRDAQNRVRDAFLTADARKVGGPVKLTLETFRALPKSRPKKIESEPDVYKPDCDNIAKLVLDALNGLAYDDDNQVTQLTVIKHPRRRRQEKMIITIDKL